LILVLPRHLIYGQNWPCPLLISAVSLLSCALCFLWSLAQAQDRQVPYPPDIQKIKERGRIVVAQYRGVQKGFFEYRPEDAPFSESSYVSNGLRIIGIDIVRATRIAEVLGVELMLDRNCPDYDTVCERVALGKADVGISKLSITLERAQYVRFTIPYARLSISLLVDRLYESRARPKGRIIRHCQEKRVRIGVLKRSAIQDYQVQAFPKSESVEYDTLEDEIEAILRGDIHVAMDDSAEILWRLKARPELSLRLRAVEIPDLTDVIAVAVSPESPNLLALMNLMMEDADIRRRVDTILTVK